MKKYTAIIIAITFICICVSGCADAGSKSADITDGTEAATTAEEVSAAATTLAEEAKSEGEAQPKVQLPVKQATEHTDLLTGTDDLSDERINTRPVAVMVNNHEDSLPQYGIDQAEIVFEVPVEHGLTRLLAIFPSFVGLPDICSVRSYRAYFPPLALGIDAFYIHWGEDQSMMDYYRSLNMDSYDGLNGGVLYGRDNKRLSDGYGLEHTSVFYGTKLQEVLESQGKRTELADPYKGKTAFNFYDSDQPYIPDGDSVNELYIDYGDMSAALKYDQETGDYKKFINGREQVDGVSGWQLFFENVIIMITPILEREDELHKEIDWTGESSNIGYYATEGKLVPITWEKADEYTQFKFYDEDGDELVVNQGRTYLTFCEESMLEMY